MCMEYQIRLTESRLIAFGQLLQHLADAEYQYQYFFET